MIPAPNEEELAAIIASQFPSLKPLLPKLIGTYVLLGYLSVSQCTRSESVSALFLYSSISSF